jgi:glutamate racemase
MAAIGIMDAGIGGLAAARAVREALPACDLLYFGDTARSPHGSRSPRLVVASALEAADLLVRAGARLLLIPSHTFSSVAAGRIRARFDLPLIDIVSLCAAEAIAATKGGVIGVVAGRTTVDSGVYFDKIESHSPALRTFQSACPLLEPLLTEGWLKKRETRMIVKKCLHPLKVRQVDTLIPALAHSPGLNEFFARKMGKGMTVIDPVAVLARGVTRTLADDPALAASLSMGDDLKVFVSDLTPQLEKAARLFYGKGVALIPSWGREAGNDAIRQGRRVHRLGGRCRR